MLSKGLELFFSEKSRSKVWFILCLIAALSLYNGLIFPYRGEEGMYTISSFDMLFNHIYTNVYCLGSYYGRPPLFNWLILSVASVVGFKHMLLAARFVTIAMTIGSSGLLYWFLRSLDQSKDFALFAVLCFLSGDLLFRSSWLAYADPTFAFFIFASICFMWVGCVRNQQRWLFIAVPALSCAFLTKALTCYVFYGIAALVLLLQQKKRRFFFHPLSIVLHVAALAFPLIWFAYVAEHNGNRAVWDLLHNFTGQHGFHFAHYVLKQLNTNVTYLLRFAPLSFIALYALVFKRFHKPKLGYPDWLKAIALATLLNLLPYALTPGVYQIRYLLPLFPFIAIMIAYVLMHSTEKVFRFAMYSIVFFIVMKVFLSPIGLPWFEHMSYDYRPVSEEIINLTKGYPLYIKKDVDSLAGRLGQLNYPAPPLTSHPRSSDNPKAFFIVADPSFSDPKYRRVKTYRITDKSFALYCYGLACDLPAIKGIIK